MSRLSLFKKFRVETPRSLAGMRPEHVGRFIDAQNAAFADRNLYMADAGTTECVATCVAARVTAWHGRLRRLGRRPAEWVHGQIVRQGPTQSALASLWLGCRAHGAGSAPWCGGWLPLREHASQR